MWLLKPDRSNPMTACDVSATKFGCPLFRDMTLRSHLLGLDMGLYESPYSEFSEA